MALKYTGAGVGAASIDPPVPARDLTDEDVAAVPGGEAAILKLEHNGTPLYERAGGEAKRNTRPLAAKPDEPEKDEE